MAKKKTKSEKDVKKEVKKINEDYIKNGAKKITDEDVEDVINKADEIKEKFEKKGPLGRFINDAKLLISLVKDYWNKEYREIPYYVIAAVVFTLLYVINPLDLIPDTIPGIGYVDDAAVVAMCLYLFEQELLEYKEWKMEKLQ